MDYSRECLEVLALLKARHNVLLMGAPACGKTTLLSEVADAFKHGFAAPPPTSQPLHVAGRPVTLPRELPTPVGGTPIPQLPSPNKSNRDVFSIVFNANSKPRDFLCGLIPNIGTDASGFKVITGKLVVANNHALGQNNASLLIIDELNRGPAVQLFGDAIVAIETGKRLNASDEVTALSWPFDVLDATTGEMESMYLSNHLYILGALNQADVSVEPLDVAFIRRWERYSLQPDPARVRGMLDAVGSNATLPTMPTLPSEIIEAAIRAWESVNEQIEVGRGAEFMLGHGVFLSRSTTPPTSMSDAYSLAIACWGAIYTHLEEVFFGDAFGIAATLRADMNSPYYRLETLSFGQEQRQIVRRPVSINSENIYSLLCWVGRH